MRGTLVAACAVLTTATLSACDGVSITVEDRGIEGSGTIVTETRDVGEFDRITLAGEGRVIVTEGLDPSLSIETDDNLLQHIETAVVNRSLEISTERDADIDPTESVVYRVTTQDVTGLTLTGAGSIELNAVEAATFSVVLSGAGDVEIGRLVADELDVEIPGVGGVEIAGVVQSQDVNLAGSGDYDGADLESARTTATTSGAGSITVWVTEALEATVTGVGSIDYYGSPRVTQAVTGVGSINSRGDK